jgi:hypothetical protein
MQTRERILSALYTIRFIAAGALLFAMFAGAFGLPEAHQVALAICGAMLASLLKAIHIVR